ncbi:unnamed protein product [Phyllotreta striolata]|uniref:Uncharacterized protein n=1 Tax=Phyllotreta striolata TaxID=444603 RepID=A0A9N9TF52_PHYSR|nr:unnamed protein product [Phyllotreta striolata]
MSDKKELKKMSRLHRARSEFLHSSSTVSIRSNFRDSFFNKLKMNRSRSVDRFRQIVEDYSELISYRSISDLRRALESHPEASNLMRESEVNELLSEIESELAQVELEDKGDQHLIQTQAETEDILNRHMTCKICHNLSLEADICSHCAVHFQRELTE